MKKYVLGFLFSKDESHVVLINKLNPAWQKGLFNGIGGKIETNETARQAMEREFLEETGVEIPAKQWTCYAQIHRPNIYLVDVFFAYSDLAYDAKTVEKEQVEITSTSNLPKNLIPNLNWLIPLARDKQADFSSPVVIQEVATERVQP